MRTQTAEKEERPAFKRLAAISVSAFTVIAAALAVSWYINRDAATTPLSFPGQKIVVGCTDNFPPFNLRDKDGNYTGYARDISMAIAKELGVDIEYKTSPRWVEVVEWLKNGDVDLIHDIAYSPERDEYFDFTIPHTLVPEVIFVRSERLDIHGLDDLEGKRIGAVRQHITHEKLLKYRGLNIVVFETPREGVEALLDGKVDAFAYPQFVFQYLVQQMGREDEIKIVGEPLGHLRYCMAVREGDHALLAYLDEAIQRIEASGKRDEIARRWFGRKVLLGLTREEVLSLIGWAVFGLLAASLGGLGYISVRYRLRKAEAVLRHNLIFQHMDDGVILTGLGGKITDWNPGAERMFGHLREEILGRRLDFLLMPEGSGELFETIMREVQDDGIWSGEIRARRKDGSQVVCSVRTTALRNGKGGITACVSIVRDITEQVRAQDRIQHLQRVLLAIRNVNQLIVHERNREKLLQGASEILNRTRDYKLVWIGLVNDETKDILPVAQAGFEAGYLKSVKITWDDSETGKGPTGTAIRTQKPFVMRDIAGDPRYKPWRKEAMRRGYASSAAVPLVCENRIFGALNVYATIPDFFDEKEIDLLFEVGQDIAFALHTIELEEEHRRAEKELQERRDANTRLAVIAEKQRELQEWINTFDTFVGKFDLNGVMIFCNKTPLKAGGLPEDDAFGKYFPDTKWWSHSETERARIVECIEKAKAGLPSRIETNFRSADGTPVPLIFNCQPVMDDGGKVKYITAEGKIIVDEVRLRTELQEAKEALEIRVKERTSELVTANEQLREEITERKRVEEALRAAEQNFRSSLDNSPLGVRIVTTKGETLYANQAVLDIYGYSGIEELKAVPTIRRYTPGSYAEHLKRKEKRKLGKPVPPDYEVSIVRKDGEVRHLEVLRKEVLWNGEAHFQVIYHDITERKRADGEKERIQAQLLQAQKMEAIGTLAGGVAHDFNNLLTAIYGHTQLAMMGLNEDDPVYQDLKEVLRSSTRASNLTRQLLLFSRRQPMEMIPIDLNKIVEDMMKMVRRLIGEDIAVTTRLEEDLWTIKADSGTIEQVIMNLMVNARDAMPEGGKITIGTENVHIDEGDCKDILDARPGNFVCLSIADTGLGMDGETVKRIFEPFFSTKGPGKGTGLGLSVVYGIVKQHEGWINVYSEPGLGAAFRIYLPTVSVEPDAVGEQQVSLAEFQGRGERILLVEDAGGVRELAARTLRKNGYVVFVATNAEEARDLFEREKGKLHLVFSDVVLPGQTGLQLVGELLSRNPELRVLLSSGYTDEKSQRAVIRERGFRFLQKPYTLSDLLQAIREVLERGASSNSLISL